MLKYERFKDCDSEYRSAPFWSWNGELKPEELIRQIHLMYEQGMGGFFMHPRGGMSTEYLSQPFMDAVKACVEEAGKLEMKAWLYDEDRFPSGSAGGRVVKGRKEFRAKALELLQIPCSEVVKDEDTLEVFVYQGADPATVQLLDVTAQEQEQIREMQGRALVFQRVYKPEEARQNNQSYTDLCNKAAVDEFIQVTHEKYREEVGADFGTIIPGIFTDEPHFNVAAQNRVRLPWTQNLEKEFREQKGYEILKQLPALFFDFPNASKVRFDFWDVISGMFVKAFTQNIYNWCQENGIDFTGHFWEHVFPSPMHTGSVMPNYEFMQAPGIDMLFNTPERRDQFGNDFIVKEVSSVANQLEKKRVLSETYGASGWDLNFEDQKKVADWQFALGINLVCQHLVLYSMEGYRKRDFPLSFMDHQPWWDTYHLLGDYIGRLSYAMAQGNYAADVLVLHPASSTWAAFNAAGGNEKLEELGKSVKELTRMLSEIQCPYDLGDDIIMERHGRVEGDTLMVGKMRYRTIILPDMAILRESSFELLKRFVLSGGRVIAAGMTPCLLDGEESVELKAFFEDEKIRKISMEKNCLCEALDELGSHRVMLEEVNGQELTGIYVHKRKCEDQETLFLCNVDKEKSFKVKLYLDSPVQVEEWDAITGEKRVIPVWKQEDKHFVKLDFHPVESHLLVMDPKGEPCLKAECTCSEGPVQSVQVSDWKVGRKEWNALTLNMCKTSLDGTSWSEKENIVAADDHLKDRLGLERGHIFARQPWMVSEEEKNRLFTVKAKYDFRTAEKLEGELYLAAESPDLFEVRINGQRVTPLDRRYKDRAFVMYDIKDYIVPGGNEILLSTDQYGVLLNLESVYIIGDFKVEKDDKGFKLCREENKLETGNWAEQGYPYYSGSFVYTSTVTLPAGGYTKVECELGEWWGVSVRVLVNGQEAGVLGWKPYKIDMTQFVRAGENEITVEVMNSLQNLMGPHDYLPVEGLVTPGSFYSPKAVKFQKSGFSGQAVVRLY